MEIANKKAFALAFRHRLEQAEQIPALPETARALLTLRNNPDAGINELGGIVEKDPAVAAQIIHYTQMAGFGYGERITSVQQAISLVLGFDKALHLSIGLAAGQCLATPRQGPLGRQAIWNQALQAANLCQELAKFSNKMTLSPGLSYLSGLLHNFGYLLFGHWYPEQYASLNHLVSHHPDEQVRTLSLHAFGISHDMIGLWLMRAWEMPDEVVIAVSEHHFPDFDGQHANYAKLVALANRLLDTPNMTDSCDYLATTSLIDALELTPQQVEQALDKVRKKFPELHQFAEDIAA